MGTSNEERQTLERLLDEPGGPLLLHLPMAIYVADSQGRFAFCNAQARALLRLSPDGVPGSSIADFFKQPERYAELARAAATRDDAAATRDDATATREEKWGSGARAGKTLVSLEVSGQDRYVEHYLSAIPGTVSGTGAPGELAFVGCMVDVTEDHLSAKRTEALQETVRELTFDIGQILHANTSTLVMVNQTLMAVARALEPDLGDDAEASRPGVLEDGMAKRAVALAASLSRLCEAGDPERRAEALAAERWEKLAVLVPALERHQENIPVPEMRVSALRAMAVETLAACREIAPGHMPREVLRDTLRAAVELQRFTCYMDTESTRTAVLQMDTSLAALRDFITTEIRADDPKARMSAASIIREAIAHLAEFTRAARVEVVWRNRSEDIEVFGSRRDLLRAVTNLLHNAVKYSWKREGYEAPWIAIDVQEDEETVTIEVENWGVPIEEGEIDAGLVFGMGYRGKRSKDRGRLGTGIGLTDSQRVAVANGGAVTISSRPARASSPDLGDRAYYRQPFLTKVRMTLPLSV